MSKNLPYDFPEQVLNENFNIIEKKDLKERLDLRAEETFTIDPEDAKDFDDALSLRDENENFKGVEPLQKLKSHSIVEKFMLYASKE